MMKRKFLTFIILLAAFGLHAQTQELTRLEEIVLSLRTGGEEAFNKAVGSLSGDAEWTPMDELGRNNEVECKVADHVPGFKLNAVLTNAENRQRRQVSTGNHLNGADSRYNYSLYEKTLKAGKTVTYTLNGRWGEQTFVLIPFDAKNSGLEPSITSGGNTFKTERLNAGMIKLTGRAVKGMPLKLKISNSSRKNASYVIINYNSRR